VADRADTEIRWLRGVEAAALLLRFTLGPMIVYHGYNKVAGPGGLEGTTKWFRALGLHPAHVHARMAAATEIAAGTALTLGLASPLPAAAVIGLMTVAAQTDHKGKGFFVFKGGWEYTAVIAGAAGVQAILGAGRWSLDGAAGRSRRGIGWALAAAVLGVGSATALLRLSYHPEPPEASEPEAAE
jgi:putative oxidoreductase